MTKTLYKEVSVLVLEKEEEKMMKTGKFRMYGQLEEQAEGTVDIEAFVFRNGEIVPADEAERTSNPGIHTAPEKNYAC